MKIEVCDYCESREIIYTCENCKQIFCKECAKTHHKLIKIGFGLRK